MNCQACNKHILYEGELLRCVACKGRYHYACLNMTSAYYLGHKAELARAWRCHSCENITRRNRNDNTPIRKQFQPSLDDTTMSIDDNPQPKSLSPIETTSITIKQNNYPTLDEFAKLLDIKLENNKKSILIDLKNTIESEINKAIYKLKQEVNLQNNELKTGQENIKKDITKINGIIENLESENEKLKLQLLEIKNQERHSDTENNYNKKIVLYGFAEHYREPEHELYNRVTHVFQEVLNINLFGYIEDARRIGNYRPRQQRPLIVELISKKMTKYIIQNSKYFRGTGLGISEYLDKRTLQIKKDLRDGLRTARQSGHHAIIRNNKLIVNGKTTDTQLTTNTVDTTICSSQSINDSHNITTKPPERHGTSSFRNKEQI